MDKNKIIGYGELMLRLTPLEDETLIEQSEGLKMGFAGAEANILIDLALLGHQASFVSAFPKNPIGRAAEQFLQKHGVGTRSITWDQNRLGTYFIEHGTSFRATRVTYDRADSSLSKTVFRAAEWEKAFSGATYFILTGITPALSEICQKNIEMALEVAKKKNVKIVFDMNFRRSLWSSADALKIYESILSKVDIVFGNLGAVTDVFGMDSSPLNDFEALQQATEHAATQLNNKGDFEYLAMTMRFQKSATNNILGGMIMQGDKSYFSRAIPTEIVDRLGGGDAFAAAALHGIIHNWSANASVDFATTAFAVTQTLKGDINYITEEEMLDMASGNLQGHVKR